MSNMASEKADAFRHAAKEQVFFERLARRFYAGVCNYLCWISRDAGLAEDLTQETFMQIWQHPPEMRGERALKAWVFRIARNQYLQHCRRARVESVLLEDCGESHPADFASSDPHISLEREDLRRAIRDAVENLPDYYREVVVLYNLEGLSLAQIAEVLDIPKGTVKSRRAKALSLLRQLLQEVGTDEL